MPAVRCPNRRTGLVEDRAPCSFDRRFSLSADCTYNVTNIVMYLDHGTHLDHDAVMAL